MDMVEFANRLLNGYANVRRTCYKCFRWESECSGRIGVDPRYPCISYDPHRKGGGEAGHTHIEQGGAAIPPPPNMDHEQLYNLALEALVVATDGACPQFHGGTCDVPAEDAYCPDKCYRSRRRCWHDSIWRKVEGSN